MEDQINPIGKTARALQDLVV
uniref:Uncharacterized protein n=1 Tax=Arundo donax TaxID=35708 RepID=A0A0A9BVZ8_ARUDO